MNLEEHRCLFDQFRVRELEDFSYYSSGQPGQRVLFIENREETVLITFEEGMACMDLIDNTENAETGELRMEEKYLHYRKWTGNRGAFFHMELPDETQKLHCLPGQLTLHRQPYSTACVEMVLQKLLESICT